jgi:hypothetical protein
MCSLMLNSARTVEYKAEHLSCEEAVTYSYPNIIIILRIFTWCIFMCEWWCAGHVVSHVQLKFS